MELHSIGDKSGRENEGPRRTAFFPWRNTQAEQSEGKPQCEGVAPVHVGQQDLQTPLPFLNTVPPFPKVAKSRDPSFAGFSSPFSEPQFIQSWQQKTPTPQEELGDKPPARGGRFTGTVVQTAPPERDAFAAAAAGLAAALSPQSGAASAFSTGKTPKPPGLRKETATDPLEPPSAWEGSAARMTSGSFSRHGSSNGRGGGPFEGPMKCQDVQKLGANGMPDGGGEQRGSWKEGALQNHGRKTAPLQERLGGSVEGGVPDWDAALFGEPRSGQKESRRNGAPARGAPGVDLGMRARVAGVQDQEAGRAQQSSESWRRDSEGSGVDEVGLAGAGAHYQMRAVNNAAGKPSEGESFQEVRMGRNGRSSLSQGQVARQGTDQGAEGGTMKRENWHHREGGGLEDGRRKRGGSSVNASLNARDVLQQQTEMLALMQKQVGNHIVSLGRILVQGSFQSS